MCVCVKIFVVSRLLYIHEHMKMENVLVVFVSGFELELRCIRLKHGTVFSCFIFGLFVETFK